MNRKLSLALACLLLAGAGMTLWGLVKGAGFLSDGPAAENVHFPLPGEIALVERSGRKMSLADLDGKVWIAGFFFTRCPGPCIQLSARMAGLQAQLAGTPVLLVSVTVDPDYDTPEVLRRYAQRLSAGDLWLFVTGDRNCLHSLIRNEFKLGVEESLAGEASDHPITHSSRLVLLDKTRAIRGYYESNDPEAIMRLIRSARELAR